MLSLGFWEKLNLEETGKTKERPDLNGSCLKDVEGLFVYLCVLGTQFFDASKFNQFPRLNSNEECLGEYGGRPCILRHTLRDLDCRA